MDILIILLLSTSWLVPREFFKVLICANNFNAATETNATGRGQHRTKAINKPQQFLHPMHIINNHSKDLVT